MWEVLFAIVFIYFLLSYIWNVQSPKGAGQMPGSLPVIGNTLTIISHMNDLLDFMLEMQREIASNGRPWTASIFPFGRGVFIARPEHLEYIQKTNFENYPKGPRFYKNVHDVLGSGIFAVDGEIWRSQRKIASNLFSAGNFRNHVTAVLHKNQDFLVDLLKDLSSKNISFDLQDVFLRFMLNSFVMMAFDRDSKVLPTKSEGLDDIVEFGRVFDFAQSIMERRFVDPTLWYREFFSAIGRKQKRSVKIIREYARQVVEERMCDFKQGNITKESGKLGSRLNATDLLGLLMEQTNDKEAIIDMVINFVIAGRDTTAQALTWAFWNLLQPENIHILEKARQEVDSINKLSSYDSYKEFIYIQAIFHETLRLHPSVPKNTKYVVKDDILPGIPEAGIDPVAIKSGWQIMWSDWVIGRMPFLWGEDAEKFKPERWIDKFGQLKKESQYKFHAFNAGPRLCLGQTLATFEAVSIFTLLLKNFDFKLDPKSEIPHYGNSLTHPIRNPYKVKVSLR